MHYLYRITNNLNGKIYIGQTVDIINRWRAHNSYAKKPEKTGQYIHRSMAKYGSENFIFEAIATCKTQEHADETELILISQYNSRNKEFGYNIKPGGSTSPHSDETKQKLREATLRQIETQGHPAQGTKRTPEQSANLSRARLEHPVDYTPEIRQKMSESHLGKVLPEEQRQKMSESIKQNWAERNEIRFADGTIKCNAPGCEVIGKAKYKIIDGIRYCNKHGLRMLRYGRLDRIKP